MVEGVDRRLEFDTVFNFRDLGGYVGAGGRPVRWRTLFRADALHRLSEPDLVRLADLGIKTVLDLRTATELEQRGRVGAMDVTFHHFPLLTETWAREELTVATDPVRRLADGYLSMLEGGREAMGGALAVIADEEHVPLVFHCAAGKDRTGVLAAVALGLLGVDDDDIAADYALSREAVERQAEWVRNNRPELIDRMADQPEVFMSAPDEAMRLFLDGLRARYGSMEAYAEAAGFDADGVAAMRAHLLEPAPS